MRQALDALEKRWGLAIQSASFGVWDLNVPASTVHYPPQWKALLGYDDNDRADTTATWRSRVHPDDLQPMLDALNGHLSGQNASYAAEFRLRAADGRYRWVLSRGRVVERDAVGQALRAVGTLTDMTERRELEDLRLARDRAEAVSRAKTEFLSRMSHELRTPLNAVLGFAQLLCNPRNTLEPVEQRRYAGQIEHAGWQLLKLIDDVLDLSRIETGRLDLQLGSVALAPGVQAALDAAASLAKQHGVAVDLGPLPVLALHADAARLQQVLGHLLANAIQYNRRGGTARIEATVAGSLCTLTVADTGLGIPATQMAHLFEPFNRLGRARSGIEGVGIGLVLARALVEAMGGRLELRSSEGVGTTVEVSLPCAIDMQ